MGWFSDLLSGRSPVFSSRKNNLMNQVYPNRNNEEAGDPTPLESNMSNTQQKKYNQQQARVLPSEGNVYGDPTRDWNNLGRGRAYSETEEFASANALPLATLSVRGGRRRGCKISKRSTKRRKNGHRRSSRR